MNPLYNPLFLARVAKSYLTDIDRIWKINNEQLKKYRDKQLRKIVQHAYSVPVYKKMYREAGVTPSDINGVGDIDKLPFITKHDLRRNFPHNLVPPNFNYKNAHVVSTSGSTGNPVSIYTDFFTIVKSLMGFIREIREYDVNWRKTRMTIIADLSEDSAEGAYLSETALPYLKPFFSLDNMQVLHVGGKPEELIHEINAFNPEFIGGYPGFLRALAVLKRKGFGENINPRIMATSGAMLDDYTKQYIEKTFTSRIFDVYGSTEGGPVAFECREGSYHIHSDFVHLEFVDDEGYPVSPGEPGHVVVTKLYGGATPIIRYTGMNDFVVPLEGTCSCGIENTSLIGHIGGRKADSIILSDGTIVPPSKITGIPGKVMHELGTDKIQQFQIVQRKSDAVDFLIIVDEELRDVGPSIDKVFDHLKKRLEDKLNGLVAVAVKEVTEIRREGGDLDTPPPVVLSKVDHSKYL